LAEGKNKRKDDLLPYTSPNDPRFKWLKETFLDYLLTWEKEVFELKGCTPTQKDSMLLSKETRAGLKMTGNIARSAKSS
jgi:hypothetical protein